MGRVSTGQYLIALRKSTLNSVYRNKKLADTPSEVFSLWGARTLMHTPAVTSAAACSVSAQAHAQPLLAVQPRVSVPEVGVKVPAAAAAAVGGGQPPGNGLAEAELGRAATRREAKLPKAAAKARRKVAARVATAAAAAAKAAAGGNGATAVSQLSANGRPDAKALKDAIKARRKVAATAAAAAKAAAAAADKAAAAARKGTRSDDEDLVESKKERRQEISQKYAFPA